MTTQNQPTNPFSPPDPQTPNQGLGNKVIQMPAVAPSQAKHIISVRPDHCAARE